MRRLKKTISDKAGKAYNFAGGIIRNIMGSRIRIMQESEMPQVLEIAERRIEPVSEQRLPATAEECFEAIVDKIIDEIKACVAESGDTSDLYMRKIFEKIKNDKLDSNYFYYITGDSVDLREASLAIYEAVGMGVCRNKASLEETVMRALGADARYFGVEVVDENGELEPIGHAICHYHRFVFGEKDGEELVGRNVYLNNNGYFMHCDDKGYFRYAGNDRVDYRLDEVYLPVAEHYATGYDEACKKAMDMEVELLKDRPEFDAREYRKLQIDLIKNIPKLREIFEQGQLAYSIKGKKITLEFKDYEVTYKKVEGKNEEGQVTADEYVWSDEARGLVPKRQVVNNLYGCEGLDVIYDVLWDEKALRTVNSRDWSGVDAEKKFYDDEGLMTREIKLRGGQFTVTDYTYDEQRRLIQANEFIDYGREIRIGASWRAWQEEMVVQTTTRQNTTRFFYDAEGERTHQIYTSRIDGGQLIEAHMTTFDRGKSKIDCLEITPNGLELIERFDIAEERFDNIYNDSVADESVFRRYVWGGAISYDKETLLKFDGTCEVKSDRLKSTYTYCVLDREKFPQGQTRRYSLTDGEVAMVTLLTPADSKIEPTENEGIHTYVKAGEDIRFGTYHEGPHSWDEKIQHHYSVQMGCGGRTDRGLLADVDMRVDIEHMDNGKKRELIMACVYQSDSGLEIEMTVPLESGGTAIKQYIFADDGRWLYFERMMDHENNRRVHTTDYSSGVRSEYSAGLFHDGAKKEERMLSAEEFAGRKAEMEAAREAVETFYSDRAWTDKVQVLRDFFVSKCPEKLMRLDGSGLMEFGIREHNVTERIDAVKNVASDMTSQGLSGIEEMRDFMVMSWDMHECAVNDTLGLAGGVKNMVAAFVAKEKPLGLKGV